MAHGLNPVLKTCKTDGKGIGSRRIFAPHFKLQVLDSYRNDADCKGNQRATARKYGIHRRQIQKWLQVENTLRSAVKQEGKPAPEPGKSEAALSRGRQLDARVPAPTQSPTQPPAPWPSEQVALDFTTHGRAALGSPAPRELAPMDLSLKRPTSLASAPVLYPSPPPLSASPSLVAAATPHPDVWDLSTKSLKRKSPSPPPHTSPKPVKLFKPYLDNIESPSKTPTPPTIVKLEPLPPPCCSALNNCEAYYYNNNNNCDIKSEYTLHELQPKSVNYYYYPGYPDYDIGGGNYVYEDISYGQNLAPLKQRQSYSLDFKLSAIDCYYQDSACKGNQRAVATKYNIHRRQIQKWLKQAEELRLRNETMKQTHAVR